MEDREEQDALALLSAWFGEDESDPPDGHLPPPDAEPRAGRRHTAIAIGVGIVAALLLTSRCSSGAAPPSTPVPPRADAGLAALSDMEEAGVDQAGGARALTEEIASSARSAALGAAAREGAAATEAVVEEHRHIGAIAIVVVRVGTDLGTVRYAVPISEGAGAPVVLEVPWRLPAAPLTAEGPGWAPVIDAALAQAVASSLEGAGYRGVRALALSASAAVPGILRVALDATAPGDSMERRHHVWVSAAAPFRITGTSHDALADDTTSSRGGTP